MFFHAIRSHTIHWKLHICENTATETRQTRLAENCLELLQVNMYRIALSGRTAVSPWDLFLGAQLPSIHQSHGNAVGKVGKGIQVHFRMEPSGRSPSLCCWSSDEGCDPEMQVWTIIVQIKIHWITDRAGPATWLSWVASNMNCMEWLKGEGWTHTDTLDSRSQKETLWAPDNVSIKEERIGWGNEGDFLLRKQKGLGDPYNGEPAPSSLAPIHIKMAGSTRTNLPTVTEEDLDPRGTERETSWKHSLELCGVLSIPFPRGLTE